MRKRWVVNRGPVYVLALVWFVGGFVAAGVMAHNGRHPHPAPAWVWAVWWGPYVLVPVCWILREVWYWARSADGWIVKRVSEPVTEDLRAHDGRGERA